MKTIPDVSPLQGQQAQLERSLIDSFLAERGLDIQEMRSRNDPEAKALLAAAVQHAALRLAEVDCRAHYVGDIRGAKINRFKA